MMVKAPLIGVVGTLAVLVFGAGPALADTAPSVTIASPTAATSSSVHVSGTVNPHGGPSATSWAFEYSREPLVEGWITALSGEYPENSAEAISTSPLPVEGTLEGLQPNTTYTVRLVAMNAGGEATPEPEATAQTSAIAPSVESESTSTLEPTEATLEAQVNPNNETTTGYLQYSTSAAVNSDGALLTSTQTATPPGPEIGSNYETHPVGPATLTALTPGMTYYYQAVAINATGTTYGHVQEFTTLDTPTVTTGEAQNITRTGATVLGTVDPAGAPTTYHIAYVPAGKYEEGTANPYANGSVTQQSTGIGDGYTVQQLPPTFIGELTPGETYDYAVIATNSVGSTIGPNESFTTSSPTPPLALTGEALGVTQTNVTLTGTVDTRGLQSTLEFELGTTPGAGSAKPATIVSESGTVVEIYASYANNLQPGTTYYYRVLATNPDGTEYGAIRSFTTTSFPEPASLPQTPLLTLPTSQSPPTTKTTTAAKPLTNTQKLAKALKACKKDKPKSKRTTCEKQAHKKYPTNKKKKTRRK